MTFPLDVIQKLVIKKLSSPKLVLLLLAVGFLAPAIPVAGAIETTNPDKAPSNPADPVPTNARRVNPCFRRGWR